MRRTTRKYSGPALDRYLKRFFAEEPGLSSAAAAQLATRGAATFSSLRVRAKPQALPRAREGVLLASGHVSARAAHPALPTSSAPAVHAPASDPAAEFDPYVIGLVPTFQREGRDGLITRLAAIAGVDNLRKMARTQQIVLPDALRQGDVTAEVLRAAIADAVAKRIADRKAAAG